LIPTNYSSAIGIEQLSIHSERSLLSSVETINSKSTEQLQSLKNVTKNVIKTNKTVSGRESLTKKLEYPLTKWSKREMAAKIRTERDRKFENIKMINEKIKRGAEVIKVYIVFAEIGQSILHIFIYCFRTPLEKHTSIN